MADVVIVLSGVQRVADRHSEAPEADTMKHAKPEGRLRSKSLIELQQYLKHHWVVYSVAVIFYMKAGPASNRLGINMHFCDKYFVLHNR